MLVLTRRIGEEIVIAGNIHVRVLGIQGQQVRLGIIAPATIPVARSELLRSSVSSNQGLGASHNEQWATHLR